MDQILPRLFLGDFADAQAVQVQDIQAVLTLCEARPHVAQGMDHVHAPIPDEVFLEHHVWAELLHALHVLLCDRHMRVLVHCRLGVSRAPSLVAAYLAQCGWTLETALALLVSRRSVVAPHSETWRGVQHFLEGRER